VSWRSTDPRSSPSKSSKPPAAPSSSAPNNTTRTAPLTAGGHKRLTAKMSCERSLAFGSPLLRCGLAGVEGAQCSIDNLRLAESPANQLGGPSLIRAGDHQ
jgi:hypothetical protein